MAVSNEADFTRNAISPKPFNATAERGRNEAKILAMPTVFVRWARQASSTMRLSRLPLTTLKETPADAEVASHRLMLRAGLIRKLAAGLYTWMPLGLRVARKVEAIAREEMNRSGAVELLMPAVQPAELWRESGRWEQYGPELLRLADRHRREFCFGPTHEEVVTDIARRELRSYRQLPVCYYQIQTKFRDEIRPRFGVMRAREFVMKDAYSFHLDSASLDETYEAMRLAYCRIFDRLGLDYRYVRADSGAIGGALSHEFHVLADSGEDEIVYSERSGYAANVEQAPAPLPRSPRSEPTQEMREIDTPGRRTIEEVSEFLGVPPERSVKTLVVEGEEDGSLVALILRGDHRLNAVKSARLDGVRNPLRLATEEEIRERLGCPVGSLGPVELDLPFYVDASAAALSDFACGANREGVHYTGVNWERDAPAERVHDIRDIEDGELGPGDAGTVRAARGIEVGHIFQLGDKYSQAMDCAVLDPGGRRRVVTMGCYGIGITRVVAAAIEQNHDERGILWPEAMAPFSVLLCPINADRDAAVRDAAEALYRKCEEMGVSVLLDDRGLRPGVMFAEADLLGIPHRFVISPRALERGTLEYQNRRKGEPEEVTTDGVAEFLDERVTPR